MPRTLRPLPSNATLVERLSRLRQLTVEQRLALASEIESGQAPLPDPLPIFRVHGQAHPYGLLSEVVSSLAHQPSTHKSQTVPRRLDDVDRDIEQVAVALVRKGVVPVDPEDELRIVSYSISVGADQLFRALWPTTSAGTKQQIQRQVRGRLFQTKVRRGYLGVCSALLDFGVVEINEAQDEASTPVAAMVHHTKMLEMLIARGLDPTLRDAVGRQAPALWPRHITRQSDFEALWRTWQQHFGGHPDVDDKATLAAGALGSAMELGQAERTMFLLEQCPADAQGLIQGRSLLQRGIDTRMLAGELNPASVSQTSMSHAMATLALRDDAQNDILGRMLPEGISEGFRFVLSPVADKAPQREQWAEQAFALCPESTLPLEDQLQCLLDQVQRWKTPTGPLFSRWLARVSISQDNALEVADLLGREREGGRLALGDWFAHHTQMPKLLNQIAQLSADDFMTLDDPRFWLGRVILRLPYCVPAAYLPSGQRYSPSEDPACHFLPKHKPNGSPYWAGQVLLAELLARGLEANADSLSDEVAGCAISTAEMYWPRLANTLTLWKLQANTPTPRGPGKKAPRL